MDSSKAALAIPEPTEDYDKRKYSLRIDYAAKVRPRLIISSGLHLFNTSQRITVPKYRLLHA